MKRGISILITFATGGWSISLTKKSWRLAMGIVTIQLCWYDFEWRYVLTLKWVSDQCQRFNIDPKKELERYFKMYSGPTVKKREKVRTE